MQAKSTLTVLAATAFIAFSVAVPAQAQMFRNGGFHTVGRHLGAPAPVDSVFDTAPVAAGGPPPVDIYTDVTAVDSNYGWGGPGFGRSDYAPHTWRAAAHRHDRITIRANARPR